MFGINTEIDTEKRYALEKFMPFNNGFDILDSIFISSIKTLPCTGTFTIQKERGRPDLLSYSIYNDTQYWWILLLYNDLSLPNDLTMGKEIRFFSISDLEGVYFSLNANQTTGGAL